MSSEWEERQREWQLKEQEFARNAELKRRIVSRAQQLAGSDDFKAAGAEMKRLGAEFKAAGFAGEGANDALWNAFSAARSAFYERRDVHYQQKDAEAAENARRKRHIIGELQGIVNSADFMKAGGRAKELTTRARASIGTMSTPSASATASTVNSSFLRLSLWRTLQTRGVTAGTSSN